MLYSRIVCNVCYIRIACGAAQRVVCCSLREAADVFMAHAKPRKRRHTYCMHRDGCGGKTTHERVLGFLMALPLLLMLPLPAASGCCVCVCVMRQSIAPVFMCDMYHILFIRCCCTVDMRYTQPTNNMHALESLCTQSVLCMCFVPQSIMILCDRHIYTNRKLVCRHGLGHTITRRDQFTDATTEWFRLSQREYHSHVFCVVFVYAWEEEYTITLAICQCHNGNAWIIMDDYSRCITSENMLRTLSLQQRDNNTRCISLCTYMCSPGNVIPGEYSHNILHTVSAGVFYSVVRAASWLSAYLRECLVFYARKRMRLSAINVWCCLRCKQSNRARAFACANVWCLVHMVLATHKIHHKHA